MSHSCVVRRSSLASFNELDVSDPRITLHLPGCGNTLTLARNSENTTIAMGAIRKPAEFPALVDGRPILPLEPWSPLPDTDPG